tara:strand:- start:9341 stop:10345 length:1005 start_codon:yes stop_codon:yes gene_type:complete
MGLPKTWQALARASATDVERVQARALVRQARQEWPLIPHWREVLGRAGIDPKKVRSLTDLDPIPALAVSQLLRLDPTRLRPTPDPGRLKRFWPASRKLALALSGSNGGAMLQRGYAVAHVDRVPVGGGFVDIESTPHDARLEGQQGARALDVLGVAERDARVVVGAVPGFLSRALTGGGSAARTAVETVAPDVESVLARIADGNVDVLLAPRTAIEAVLEAGVGSLKVVAATDGPTPREVRAAWHAKGVRAGDLAALPLARLLLAEEPYDQDGPLGLAISPDLVRIEPERGMALTHLAHRGTTLVRCTGVLPAGTYLPAGIPRRRRSLPRWLGE